MAQSYEKHLQLSYMIVRKRTGIALFSLPLHKIGCKKKQSGKNSILIKFLPD